MRKQIRKIIYFIIVLILAGSAYGILSNNGSKELMIATLHIY
jgi:archaellum component FlaG (FlaF/FlaG flagellin family)